jgi:hypothetical protein
MDYKRRFLVVLTLLFVAFARPALSGFAPTAGYVVYVALSPVELRTEKASSDRKDDFSDLIAKTLVELLPNYLQKGIERALDRRVVLVNDQLGTGLVEIPNIELNPTVVNMGAIGIRVSVRVMRRSDSSSDRSAQDSGEEILLLAPNTNFGELDDKLNDLGVRVAKRVSDPATPQVAPSILTRLPQGILALNCLSPSDPGDAQMARLARTLTIELSYYLTQAARKRNLDLSVRGLDLKDSLASCDPQWVNGAPRVTASNDARIENFSWTGSISRDPKNKDRLMLMVRTRDIAAGGNYRPLPAVQVVDSTESALAALAGKLIDNFTDQYAKSQYRVFFHFETDALRKNVGQKLISVLSDKGYNVVGSDPPDGSIAASWIDFFNEEDCRAASEIRQAVVPLIGTGAANPFLRRQPSNRQGTIGVWLSSKQIVSPPTVVCEQSLR